MVNELYIIYIGVPEHLDPRITREFWSSTARQFNGYTRADVTGGWLSPDGRLIEEPAIRAEIITDLPYSVVRDWASRAASLYSQEYVFVVRLGTRGAELVKNPDFNVTSSLEKASH
jgi:hypothetical protein